MTAPAEKDLGTCMRGDGFRMTFTLENDWLGVNFDEMKFTVRKRIPPSSVTSDTDSDVLAQVTKTGGGITFDPLDDTQGAAAVLSDVTTAWPGGARVYWDLQGQVNGDPKSPYTIGRGTFTVAGDVTRSDD
jgi:hypothetical protein